MESLEAVSESEKVSLASVFVSIKSRRCQWKDISFHMPKAHVQGMVPVFPFKLQLARFKSKTKSQGIHTAHSLPIGNLCTTQGV